MNSVSKLHSSAMTNSERIAKYRRKKKMMDPSYQIAENQRLESQRKMKVKNMSERELKTYRANVTDRQRKYRAKKKQLQLEEIKKATSMVKTAPYKSPQSMGKAISKCLKSLPYSPTKKKAVVSGVANKIGLKVQQKMDDTLSEKSEINNLVEEFFYRSDIVYTMPGMNDEMIIWDNNGIKSKARKYYLTMFLREAHKIFEETFEKISFSKFCNLRPKNVLLLKNSPIDQCKCKLHENFRLKLKALKITYDGEWWKNNLCECNNSNLNSDCWQGKCLICGNGKLIEFQINAGSIVSWEEWIKDGSSSKIRKTTQNGCNAQLKELILNDLPLFQEHVRIKRIQSNSFEQDKLNDNNRILQIDFAMAYSCDYQNEIQSALWSRENVQLFTAALFFKNKCTTFVICSDTKDKGSQLPENTALIDGFTSYYSYPRKQSGYSGVATYCKDIFMPDDAEEGLSGVLSGKTDNSLLSNLQLLDDSALDLSELDSEGRVIITYHLIKFNDELRHLAVINIYCPRVDPDKPERHLYKMQFCHLLEAKARKLCEDGCFVMIVGDINISCSIIDHCDPGDENEFNASEARQWLKSFLSSKIGYFNGDVFMVDAFRHIYPNRRNAYTCWNTKTGARLTNYGTRIDYILISSNLIPLLLKCDLMTDYEGSDHCPVFAELKCDAVPTSTPSVPSLCTKLWPEFYGKQQTLQQFLKKTQDLADNLTRTTHVKKTSSDKSNKQKSIKNFFKTSTVEGKSQSKDNKYLDTKCVNNGTAVENDEIVNCSQNSSNSDKSVDAEIAVSSSPKNSSQVSEWKSVLKGPPKPPLCSGHKKPCALRTVKKKGPNFGRQFFMCSQPAGHSSNPEANCNFFKWVSAAKVCTLK